MTKADIIQKLKVIKETTESYFQFSETEDEINEVFFHQDFLCIGVSCGNPDYCTIGAINDLLSIMYRFDENDDRWFEFIFDFGKYRISAQLNFTNEDNRISLFNVQSREWELEDISLKEIRQIEEHIRQIVSDKESV